MSSAPKDPPAVSLAPLFRPRAIAVVGVKGGPFDPMARDSMARRFVENLLRHGYPHPVYPVNPRYEKVGELRCYPSVRDIPGPVDAALIIAPRARIAEAIADCGAKGVKAATIVTSGYADAGPAGKAEEDALVALARQHGIRLVGPNCFGYFNSHARVNVFGSATLLTRELLAGPIGLVTQSGAVAASIVDRAQERGIGFSIVVTTGNQADVDNVECLEAIVEDPDTRVVALFAEGLGDMARFRAVAARAARLGKPFVALKSGASEIGRAAALAHTGSLVGDDAVYAAAFRQDGIVRCVDPDDIFMNAALLANHSGEAPGPATCRLAVVSMSGAMGGIVADAAERHGVPMATLAEATQATLHAIEGVPPHLNPLDAAMATWSGDFAVVARIAGILAADPGVDVVMFAISGAPYAERVIDECAASVGAAGKVFVPLWAADRLDTAHAVKRLASERVTVYENAESALRAIAALGVHRRHQARIRGAAASTASVMAPVDVARRARALALLDDAGPVLSEYRSKQILALYGIAVPPDARAATAAEAAAAATRIGFPVALKIDSADIPHKTEADGIRLDLRDAEAVRVAFDAIVRSARAYRPDARIDGVLVAPMARRGVELVVGTYHDAQCGPVVLAGSGGIFVEVLRDTALRLAPIDATDANAMLDTLRGKALLEGVRGAPAADREAVVAILLALSTLVTELAGEVSEIDINPLVVHATGEGATVVDALVVRRPRPS